MLQFFYKDEKNNDECNYAISFQYFSIKILQNLLHEPWNLQFMYTHVFIHININHHDTCYKNTNTLIQKQN